MPLNYQIRVVGHLDSHWSPWLDGFTIAHTADGETLLEGAVVDQSALYGLIRKMSDLGLTLIALTRHEPAAPADLLRPHSYTG